MKLYYCNKVFHLLTFQFENWIIGNKNRFFLHLIFDHFNKIKIKCKYQEFIIHSNNVIVRVNSYLVINFYFLIEFKMKILINKFCSAIVLE